MTARSGMPTMSLKIAAFACLLAGVRVGHAIFRSDQPQADLADPNTAFPESIAIDDGKPLSASSASSLFEANSPNAEPETDEEDLAEHEDLGRGVEASKDEEFFGPRRRRKLAKPKLPTPPKLAKPKLPTPPKKTSKRDQALAGKSDQVKKCCMDGWLQGKTLFRFFDCA